jgi:hypothetical protein
MYECIFMYIFINIQEIKSISTLLVALFMLINPHKMDTLQQEGILQDTASIRQEKVSQMNTPTLQTRLIHYGVYCIHIHIYAYIHTYVHIKLHIKEKKLTYFYTHRSPLFRTVLFITECIVVLDTFICIFIYVYIYVCICIYLLISISLYIHMNIPIYIPIFT